MCQWAKFKPSARPLRRRAPGRALGCKFHQGNPAWGKPSEGSSRGLELRPSTLSKWLYGLILGGNDIGPTACPRQGPSRWGTPPLVELAAKSPAWGKPLEGSDRGLELRPSTLSKWLYGLI